jgi:hypothetical protein
MSVSAAAPTESTAFFFSAIGARPCWGFPARSAGTLALAEIRADDHPWGWRPNGGGAEGTATLPRRRRGVCSADFCDSPSCDAMTLNALLGVGQAAQLMAKAAPGWPASV